MDKDMDRFIFHDIGVKGKINKNYLKKDRRNESEERNGY